MTRESFSSEPSKTSEQSSDGWKSGNLELDPTGRSIIESVERISTPHGWFQYMFEARFGDEGILIFPDQSRMDSDLVDSTLVYIPEKVARDVMPIVKDSVNEEQGNGKVTSFIRQSIAEKSLMVAGKWREEYGDERPVPGTHDLLMLIFSDSETEIKYWDRASEVLRDYMRALDESDGDHRAAIERLNA